jgi:hypothetical protein
MALALRTTTAFEKDLRRARKQEKDLDKLEAIVNVERELGRALGLSRRLRLGPTLPADRRGRVSPASSGSSKLTHLC